MPLSWIIVLLKLCTQRCTLVTFTRENSHLQCCYTYLSTRVCFDPLYLVKVTALHFLFPFSNNKPFICYFDLLIHTYMSQLTFFVDDDGLNHEHHLMVKVCMQGCGGRLAQNQTSGSTVIKKFPVEPLYVQGWYSVGDLTHTGCCYIPLLMPQYYL